MTLLFDRKLEIHLFVGMEKHIKKDLDMSFEIIATSDSKPNFAKFNIMGLNYDSRNLFSEELEAVEIYAGYKNDLGLLFRGAWDYKTSLVKHSQPEADWITTFECGDGESNFNNTFFEKTYASGASILTIIEDMARGFGLPFEIDYDNGDKINSSVTFSGKTKDVLDDFTAEYRLVWAIQHGVVEVTSEFAPPQNDSSAVVLTPTTGLVGFPVLTESGVELKTMMLPLIQPKRLIKIDPASLETNLGKTENKIKGKNPPKPNANGIYIVDQIRSVGDNMGGEFNRYVTAKLT